MMANIGPLTTTFTAPASCTAATGLYQIWHDDTYHFEQGPLASMSDCFPGGYNAAAPSQYYSPGVCPGGYTTACSSLEVVSATETETAFTCCPMGRVLYLCNADAATGSLHLGCTTMFNGNVGIDLLTAISEGSTYSTAVVASSGDGIGAHSIAIRTRVADTTSNSVLATATSHVASVSTPTNSSTASSGLSPVSIAGIGVGVGVLVLIITGALVFFLCMRRRKQQTRAGNTPLLRQHEHSPKLGPYTPRGPPPPRPPRPLDTPSIGPRGPISPPRRQYNSSHTLLSPLSPTLSTSSSVFKNAREVEFYTVRNVEIRKKPPRLHLHQQRSPPPPTPPPPSGRDSRGSSKPKSPSTTRDSISTFATLLNGPFELPGEFSDEIEKHKHHHHDEYYELHELYGSTSPGMKSFDTALSSELPGSFPLPPTSPTKLPPPYEGLHRGAQGLVVELDVEPPVVMAPERTFDSALQRHHRAPSSRWGRGTSWAPAELPSHEQGGFL